MDISLSDLIEAQEAQDALGGLQSQHSKSFDLLSSNNNHLNSVQQDASDSRYYKRKSRSGPPGMKINVSSSSTVPQSSSSYDQITSPTSVLKTPTYLIGPPLSPSSTTGFSVNSLSSSSSLKPRQSFKSLQQFKKQQTQSPLEHFIRLLVIIDSNMSFSIVVDKRDTIEYLAHQIKAEYKLKYYNENHGESSHVFSSSSNHLKNVNCLDKSGSKKVQPKSLRPLECDLLYTQNMISLRYDRKVEEVLENNSIIRITNSPGSNEELSINKIFQDNLVTNSTNITTSNSNGQIAIPSNQDISCQGSTDNNLVLCESPTIEDCTDAASINSQQRQQKVTIRSDLDDKEKRKESVLRKLSLFSRKKSLPIESSQLSLGSILKPEDTNLTPPSNSNNILQAQDPSIYSSSSSSALGNSGQGSTIFVAGAQSTITSTANSNVNNHTTGKSRRTSLPEMIKNTIFFQLAPPPIITRIQTSSNESRTTIGSSNKASLVEHNQNNTNRPESKQSDSMSLLNVSNNDLQNNCSKNGSKSHFASSQPEVPSLLEQHLEDHHTLILPKMVVTLPKKPITDCSNLNLSLSDRFNIILSNKCFMEGFLKFLIEGVSAENLLFWLDVSVFRTCPEQRMQALLAAQIYRTYLSSNAPLRIDVPEEIKKEIRVPKFILDNTTLQLLEESKINEKSESQVKLSLSIFDDVQQHVYGNLKASNFLRFLKSPIYENFVNATRAERSIYLQGYIEFSLYDAFRPKSEFEITDLLTSIDTDLLSQYKMQSLRPSSKSEKMGKYDDPTNFSKSHGDNQRQEETSHVENVETSKDASSNLSYVENAINNIKRKLSITKKGSESFNILTSPVEDFGVYLDNFDTFVDRFKGKIFHSIVNKYFPGSTIIPEESMLQYFLKSRKLKIVEKKERKEKEKRIQKFFGEKPNKATLQKQSTNIKTNRKLEVLERDQSFNDNRNEFSTGYYHPPAETTNEANMAKRLKAKKLNDFFGVQVAPDALVRSTGSLNTISRSLSEGFASTDKFNSEELLTSLSKQNLLEKESAVLFSTSFDSCDSKNNSSSSLHIREGPLRRSNALRMGTREKLDLKRRKEKLKRLLGEDLSYNVVKKTQKNPVSSREELLEMHQQYLNEEEYGSRLSSGQISLSNLNSYQQLNESDDVNKKVLRQKLKRLTHLLGEQITEDELIKAAQQARFNKRAIHRKSNGSSKRKEGNASSTTTLHLLLQEDDPEFNKLMKTVYIRKHKKLAQILGSALPGEMVAGIGMNDTVIGNYKDNIGNRRELLSQEGFSTADSSDQKGSKDSINNSSTEGLRKVDEEKQSQNPENVVFGTPVPSPINHYNFLGTPLTPTSAGTSGMISTGSSASLTLYYETLINYSFNKNGGNSNKYELPMSVLSPATVNNNAHFEHGIASEAIESGQPSSSLDENRHYKIRLGKASYELQPNSNHFDSRVSHLNDNSQQLIPLADAGEDIFVVAKTSKSIEQINKVKKMKKVDKIKNFFGEQPSWEALLEQVYSDNIEAEIDRDVQALLDLKKELVILRTHIEGLPSDSSASNSITDLPSTKSTPIQQQQQQPGKRSPESLPSKKGPPGYTGDLTSAITSFQPLVTTMSNSNSNSIDFKPIIQQTQFKSENMTNTVTTFSNPELESHRMGHHN